MEQTRAFPGTEFIITHLFTVQNCSCNIPSGALWNQKVSGHIDGTHGVGDESVEEHFTARDEAPSPMRL